MSLCVLFRIRKATQLWDSKHFYEPDSLPLCFCPSWLHLLNCVGSSSTEILRQRLPRTLWTLRVPVSGWVTLKGLFLEFVKVHRKGKVSSKC